MSDVFINRLGRSLVVAPSDTGRLSFLAERRSAVLNKDSGEVERVLARWVFADLPGRTLKDAWGNPYDHQAHHLLAGSLADGERFLAELAEIGVTIAEEPQLFVPLKTVELHDESDSDLLRERHARAFAVAIRRLPRVSDLNTQIHDSDLIGQ